MKYFKKQAMSRTITDEFGHYIKNLLTKRPSPESMEMTRNLINDLDGIGAGRGESISKIKNKEFESLLKPIRTAEVEYQTAHKNFQSAKSIPNKIRLKKASNNLATIGMFNHRPGRNSNVLIKLHRSRAYLRNPPEVKEARAFRLYSPQNKFPARVKDITNMLTKIIGKK